MRQLLVNRCKLLLAATARILQVRKELRMLVLQMLEVFRHSTRTLELAIIDEAVDGRLVKQHNVRDAIVLVEVSHRAVAAFPHRLVNGVVCVARWILEEDSAELRESLGRDQLLLLC